MSSLFVKRPEALIFEQIELNIKDDKQNKVSVSIFNARLNVIKFFFRKHLKVIMNIETYT